MTLASRLREHFQVELFDKGRGLGGRLASRRSGARQFDHGAPFVTARHPEFKRLLRTLPTAEWNPRLTTLSRQVKPYKRDWFEPHYVGIPCMNDLLRPLVDGLPLHLGEPIEAVSERGHLLRAGRWEGPFDQIVLTCPPVQCRALLPGEEFAALEAVQMEPCFALLLGFREGFATPPWEGAVAREEEPELPLAWLGWSRSSPGCLTVHSTASWAAKHLEDPPDSVAEALREAVSDLTGLDLHQVEFSRLHRWRYARTRRALTEVDPAASPYLLDRERGLAACGDWCTGSRAESAFLSACALAEALLANA